MLHTEADENKKYLYFRSVRVESLESHPLRQKSDLYDPAKYLLLGGICFFTSYSRIGSYPHLVDFSAREVQRVVQASCTTVPRSPVPPNRVFISGINKLTDRQAKNLKPGARRSKSATVINFGSLPHLRASKYGGCSGKKGTRKSSSP